MIVRKPAPSYAAPLLLLGLFAGACSQQRVATPSRALDRPSDVALFCVDFDFQIDFDGDGAADSCPGQLPQRRGGEGDDLYLRRVGAYLDVLCQGIVSVDAAPPPTATVLPQEECDGPHRQRRSETLLAPARAAAQLLGRDPAYPCCQPGDTTCNITPSVCSRRKLEALVTNTGRGEVAVVDTQVQVSGLNTFGQIQNLHTGKPGFGFLPVGRLPQHVRTATPTAQTDGSGRGVATNAWAATSNTGSCDLSLIELKPVADLIARPADCGVGSCPQRVVPFAAGPTQPLGARPAWIELAPWAPAERRAVVAFPGCGLVAEVDMKTGRLIEGVGFDERGAARRLAPGDLASLRCPSECGAFSAQDTPDMGGGAAPGGRAAGQPTTLAVDADGRRLIIGDSASAALTIVPFDPAAADGARLGAPRQVPLDYTGLVDSPDSAQRGVDVVRVSPRSAAGVFVYALARDATVRVLDLDQEIECETNPDPRHLQSLVAAGKLTLRPDEQIGDTLRRLACLPVGATPRSPLSNSPGISLPGGALPRDVAFVRQDIACDPSVQDCPYRPDLAADDATTGWLPAAPSVWVGDFAWILGSNGSVQAVQIADYCPMPSFRACYPAQGTARRAALLSTRSIGQPSPELVDLPALQQATWVSPLDRMPHGKRPLTSRLTDTDPGPRVETAKPGDPLYVVRVPGDSAASATGPEPDPNAPPGSTRLVLPAPADYYYLPTDPLCGLVLADPLNQRGAGGEPTYRPKTIAAFPDPNAVRNEAWTLDWEGVLPGTSRGTGILSPDGGLLDLGGLYCNRGVEPGDKLWLPGCQTNGDCAGGICVREQSAGSAPGICLPTTADGDVCRRASQGLTADRPVSGTDATVWAATWLRRYRVLRAEQQRSLTYPLIQLACSAQLPCPSGLSCNAGTCEARDTMDRLVLGEIAEPEHLAEQRRCDGLDYGQACGDDAAINVQLRGAPRCAATADCPNGWLCDTVRKRCDVPLSDQSRLVSRRTTCRADADESSVGPDGVISKPIKRCVLECEDTLDCGVGFVCAHSSYERFEGPLPRPKARCVRAPLVAEGAPISDGAGQHPMSRAEASAVLRACFSGSASYQVRGGDAFLVRGSQSAAPVLENVGKDGACVRPQPGDPFFQAARLRQPRLRLGPRQGLGAGDPLLCPSQDQWISHRQPTPARSGSCAEAVSRGFVKLPSGVQLNVAAQPDPLRRDSWDPWLQREAELLSSLPLGAPASCVLTDAGAEAPGTTTCGDGSRPPCPRRIHFENPFLNLVLRLPRRMTPLVLDGRTIAGAEWALPPEGYSVSFNALGGFRPYAINATVPAGQLAQSLRAASLAPDGSVFIVDEGRTGSATGLRGQLMRIFRVDMDQSFLVR